MLYSSLVAVLLSLELVAQTPSKAASWVVVQSHDGGFSFSMPGKPHEQTNDIPGTNGRVKMKVYTHSVQDAALIVQHTPLPAPVPANMVAARLDAVKKTASPNLPKLVAEKRISVGNVTGIELVHSGPMGQDKRNMTVKLHMFIKGPSAYTMIAMSVPGKPLPPEADLFLDSIRFGGQPAAMAGAKPAAGPAKRKPLAKIPLVDKTPEDALRTFMMAMTMADEETLRAVTVPTPELDVLLSGEPPPASVIEDLKQKLIKLPIERMKAGDEVKMPGNKVHVIRAGEVGRDRAVLQSEGAPVPHHLRLVSGHWKVDAGPIIAARKAAAAAQQKAGAGR